MADIILNWKLLFLVFRAEGRNSGCLIRLCCIIWVCFDLAINSLIGFTPYVDNYAHLGGLVYGILLALTMLERLPLSFFDKGNGTCFKFRMFMIRFLGATIAAVLVVVSAVLLIRSDGTATPCPKCRYISCLPFPFWTEKKWWYCDGCDGISGDISRLRGTEYFSELTLYCPYSDIVQVDLESKYSEVSQIELVLPDFCREHC